MATARAFLMMVCATLLAGCGGDVGDGVAPNAIETVRLDENGRAILTFELNRPAEAHFDLFAVPDEAGAISARFRRPGEADEKGEADGVDAGGGALFPGRYEAVIEAENPGPAELQARIRLEPPLDAHEPNDTPETALDVTPPFRSVIRLARGDEDWFRVDAPSQGVIGVHLHYPGGQYSGPRIRVLDADGELIFETGEDPWAWRGMRYVRAEGRPILIGVRDTDPWDDGEPQALKGVEIVHYAPEDGPRPGALVTLGLEEEDPSFFQLDLVGRAVGTTPVRADEADAVARELSRAIAARPGPRLWPTLLAVIGMFLAGAAAGWLLRGLRS